MAHTSLTARYAFITSAFAAAALFVSAPAFASAPNLTPKVLQCDGSFATGSVTSHPTPTVRVEEQTATGLKIGQRRLSVLPASTIALWRFDANFDVFVSSGYSVGCPSGCCKTYIYSYNDADGSASLRTGLCSYEDTVNNNCSNLTVMTAFGELNRFS